MGHDLTLIRGTDDERGPAQWTLDTLAETARDAGGGTFTIRCDLSPGAARIEVEDTGGPWRPRKPDDRPHGLDIIRALTGPRGWGTQATGSGGRLTWARLKW